MGTDRELSIYQTPISNSSFINFIAYNNLPQPNRQLQSLDLVLTILVFFRSQSSVVRRMRSKSGSPPSRPPTVGSVRSQPISLPPIFGTSTSSFNATSSASIFGTLNSPYHPTSVSTSGFSSLTTPIARLGSSTLSTPRSLRLDSGKVPLTLPERVTVKPINKSNSALNPCLKNKVAGTRFEILTVKVKS